MRAEHFNPFLAAASEVFATMLRCELTRGPLTLKTNRALPLEISGIIELSGSLSGLVVVSFGRETALAVTEILLRTRLDSLNADVADAVGEIANMIAGTAKTKFDDPDLSIGLPRVVLGKHHLANFPPRSTPLSLPFESPLGPLCIESALVAGLVSCG